MAPEIWIPLLVICAIVTFGIWLVSESDIGEDIQLDLEMARMLIGELLIARTEFRVEYDDDFVIIETGDKDGIALMEDYRDYDYPCG